MGRRYKEEPQNLTPERMVNSLVYNHCALWQVLSGVWTELPGLCGGRRGGLLSGSCRSLTTGETVMKALGFVVERHVCSEHTQLVWAPNTALVQDGIQHCIPEGVGAHLSIDRGLSHAPPLTLPRRPFSVCVQGGLAHCTDCFQLPTPCWVSTFAIGSPFLFHERPSRSLSAPGRG